MKTLITLMLVAGMVISPLAISSPNGGLADRINEARTYPNMSVEQDTDDRKSSKSEKKENKEHTCHSQRQ